MNNTYFFIEDEKEAREFFINCLEKGIYTTIERDKGYWCIGIDNNKTLVAKNGKKEN